MQRTFTGHITPQDKARSDYMYVPFDLPAPARRLTVSYQYSARMSHDRVEGGNVIDIGLFDSRGTDFPGSAGFRGWSGSDRLTFTIATEEATPGYLPGPLPAGRYHVILGLYRIWPQGADYEIEIRAELDDAVQPASQTPAPTATAMTLPKVVPGPAQPHLWLRGDLQTHTYHSDGKGSPQQLVAKARDLNLDFLAITDHNTVSHHPTLHKLANEDLLLIPGQEVTTYYGHMNVWGTGRWCDFRAQSDSHMNAIIDLAHRNGALCSINHPKEGGPAWGYSTSLAVDAMEVWQGPWPNRNVESLTLWDSMLREGRRLPAVGGSDYHCPSDEETGFLRLGQPTTWVKAAERSAAGVLEAIRAGRASISASPTGPRLDMYAVGRNDRAEMGEYLSAELGETIQVTTDVHDGENYFLRILTETGVVHEEEVTTNPASIAANIRAQRYVRAELVGDMSSDQLPENVPDNIDLHEWRWALSNPIYITPQAEVREEKLRRDV